MPWFIPFCRGVLWDAQGRFGKVGMFGIFWGYLRDGIGMLAFRAV